MSDSDYNHGDQVPPDFGGYSPSPEVQPVVAPAADEPTNIAWSVPYEEMPPASIASDEPAGIPWPAVVYDDENPQWSVAPDEPMSIDFSASFERSEQPDVDADQQQWVHAQVERFAQLDPFERMGKSTVQSMYDDGADLSSLRAVAAALGHRGRGSDPHDSNNTQFVDFDQQLTRLLLGLNDQWRSAAKQSTTDDLIISATTLAGNQSVPGNTESFNQVQLKIVADELTTRYNAEIDSWLNGVPADAAEIHIAEMFQAASVTSDPFLEASAQAREERLHERIFHASVNSLSHDSLDDIGARIQELRGANGIAARAELDAIRFHIEVLKRRSESDLWIDPNGRKGTRVALGRLETLEAYERGAAANASLPGAIIFHYTGNAELAVAVNGLMRPVNRWQNDHAAQRLNTAPSLERPPMIDRRPAPDRRPADPPSLKHD